MNPYKVLGVRPNASKDEIESAYKNMIESSSNDYFDDNPKEFLTDEKVNQVNAAYYELMNELKYKEIRSLIETEQFIAAETELNLISAKGDAEWNYLKGFVMLKKGWVQSGITHLKKAYELNPTNPEYEETLQLLNRKIREIKANYARATKQNSQNDMDLCGGNSGGGGNNMDMCNSLPMGNGQGGANPLANMNLGNMNMGNSGNGQTPPMNNMGGNPLQNMLLQNMMSPNNMNMCGGGGGNPMNMCGGGGRGGMC